MSIKIGHAEEVAEVAARRAWENFDIDVSYNYANVKSDGVTPETQMTAVEHAQKEEVHLGVLTLSEQADLLGILNSVSTLTAMKALDAPAPHTTPHFWARACRYKFCIG